MKSYFWMSFAFMGWAYFELSGGADFIPEQPAPQLLADATANTATADIEKTIPATHADTAVMAAVSPPNVVPAAIKAPIETIIEIPAISPAILAEEAIDLRAVAGSRVNMRMGPGTSFDVITTLTGGTALEVIDITAEGWANVRIIERGIEGWMAARLLTDPQT